MITLLLTLLLGLGGFHGAPAAHAAGIGPGHHMRITDSTVGPPSN